MPDAETLINEIDAWLPQTQCTQCGYPRCRSYAEAIVSGEADINRCPPGNDITIQGLAKLLAREALPLNTECGEHSARGIAVIDETLCIGCTLCIQACPVDAIIGAAKHMHTVLLRDCTGCDLCLPPCPMDCIIMRDWQGGIHSDWRWPEYSPEFTGHARQRTEARLRRLLINQASPGQDRVTDRSALQNEIRAAVARVKARRGKAAT
ncbi:MAG: hypothetical protein BMS9Abin36_1412 [Gammaproteobacteria bacterium]|nr:MAG: hypothetical protein BMS9Abin36_1412 [Gammaproteobacteria bacterium]